MHLCYSGICFEFDITRHPAKTSSRSFFQSPGGHRFAHSNRMSARKVERTVVGPGAAAQPKLKERSIAPEYDVSQYQSVLLGYYGCANEQQL